MDYVQLPLDKVAVGREVTVWAIEDGYRTWGQGGVVTALDPQLVVTAAGIDHKFDTSKVAAGAFMVEIAVPTDPRECVNYGPDCSGDVEFFDPSGRGRGAQRCAHHREVRAASYANSIEQYAHSDTPPSWFDPTYAGESWTDD